MSRYLKSFIIMLMAVLLHDTANAGMPRSMTEGQPSAVPATSAASVAPVTEGPRFILTASVCVNRQQASGDTSCVPLTNTRLEARLHEAANASNTHQMTFGAGTPPTVSNASTVDASSPAVVSYREGFDLTVTPLYESDDVLIVQYEITADHFTGWEYSSKDAKSTAREPIIQRAHLVGTARLRQGGSTQLDRNGYRFDITYAQRAGRLYVGDL